MPSKTNTKVHTQYRLKSGTLVPGSTTVLGLINKPFLVEWAYKCGCQGIDIHKVRNQATSVGTLTHELILDDFKGIKPDLGDYTPNQIAEAQNSLRSFYAWRKQHSMKVILIEQPLVSEVYGFGGTPDIYGTMTEGNVLLDFKTSKSVYFEYLVQVASYGQLIFENYGTPPDKGQILRINKEANEDFEIRTVSRMDRYFEVFRHLLMIYNLQRELS